MTLTMKSKIAEAKKMMGNNKFIPAEYEHARNEWEGVTPAWATLKKYAAEIGLKSEQASFEWHSDGSMLDELSGIEEGTVFYYTAYYFAN